MACMAMQTEAAPHVRPLMGTVRTAKGLYETGRGVARASMAVCRWSAAGHVYRPVPVALGDKQQLSWRWRDHGPRPFVKVGRPANRAFRRECMRLKLWV
jgi:hypothetical protein